MPDVIVRFQKHRLHLDHTIYAIRLVNANHSMLTFDKGEEITFKRIGEEHPRGFTIDFEGDSNLHQIVIADDSEAKMPIGSFDVKQVNKYTISFPVDVDTHGEIVVDLDPVIIINPG